MRVYENKEELKAEIKNHLKSIFYSYQSGFCFRSGFLNISALDIGYRYTLSLHIHLSTS